MNFEEAKLGFITDTTMMTQHDFLKPEALKLETKPNPECGTQPRNGELRLLFFGKNFGSVFRNDLVPLYKLLHIRSINTILVEVGKDGL